ncbi:hypothetical protein [Krasilnikovia cinnamomea]|uniref:hypothetical protein n=1 Tax=Krasilnikovia cinnamomea TaxID=349313 RepID=UPI0013EF48F8|nr:hypothetical protein [Krasilnikovia cinnamomea]
MIEATGLVPELVDFAGSGEGPADFTGFEADHADVVDDPAGPHHDDPDRWSEPSGRLTGHAPEDHDGADLSPSDDPWSPGPEPEMY